MPGKDPIEIEGTVTACLPDNVFRVSLANGHSLIGHLAGDAVLDANPMLPGEKVVLQVSPCDLSKGRITCRQK